MSEKQTYYCLGCCKTHDRKDFYMSYNPSHKNGVYPFCKKYIKEEVYINNEDIDIEKFKDILRQADAPFIESEFEGATNEKRQTVGAYFSRINMVQNRGLTWRSSVFENILSDEIQNESVQNKQDVEINNEIVKPKEEEFEIESEFKITPTMKRKWGDKFSPTQIAQLEDLYLGMDRCFDIENRSQEEYLKTACLYQMRNMEAIRAGNSNEAKKWGDLFDSYMASGKLKPNQMSESDKMGGITNFSNFFKFVEKTNGFTPVFPDLILDDIDYAIYMFINYNRELLGSQPIELGEVKDFMTYDYTSGQEIVFPKSKEESEEHGT